LESSVGAVCGVWSAALDDLIVFHAAWGHFFVEELHSLKKHVNSVAVQQGVAHSLLVCVFYGCESGGEDNEYTSLEWYCRDTALLWR
jgi:hypothetical protein